MSSPPLRPHRSPTPMFELSPMKHPLVEELAFDRGGDLAKNDADDAPGIFVKHEGFDEEMVPISSNTFFDVGVVRYPTPSGNSVALDDGYPYQQPQQQQQQEQLQGQNPYGIAEYGQVYAENMPPIESTIISTMDNNDSTQMLGSFPENSGFVPQYGQVERKQAVASTSSQQRQTVSITPSSSQLLSTPMRSGSRRRSSTVNSNSPLLRQTPSRITKSHRRTRSRLSLDASGAAAIITETHEGRSPRCNPFYIPSSNNSPRVASPVSTASMTPSIYQDEEIIQHEPLSSVYPMMLHHQDYATPANLSLQIAGQHLGVQLEDPPSFLSDPSLSESAVPQVIPEFPGDPSQSYIDQQVHQQRYQQHKHQLEQQHQQQQQQLQQHQQQTQQHRRQHRQDSNSQHEKRHSSSSTRKNNERPVQRPPNQLPKISQPLATHLSRSHSTIDLTTHVAPPEITKYDILVPRKRLAKSQSATDISSDGKKPHQCPLCGGIFQRPEHLKRHMRSHSSEKPFECDECGKKFNRADNMKAHQRKLHGRDI